MKIKKTPSRKLAPQPTVLRNLIKRLEECPQDQIVGLAEDLKEWNFPRGDLFQWITVLNRFDDILQHICEDYHLDSIQSREFESDVKQLIIAIMNISKVLSENCTNRSIYNSYEHLNALLNTCDIDVMEAVLRFMLRPAQRNSNPRMMRSNFVPPQEKIIELARGWMFPVDIVGLRSDDVQVSDDMTCVKLQFYRTRSETDAGGDHEGVNVVTAQLANSDKCDIEVFKDLTSQHHIPVKYHFELANRIRIANHISNPKQRRQLFIIHLISIAIMAHTVSKSTADNRVFVYEPHLVGHLAELIHPDKSIPFDVQAYAMYALEAISRCYDHRLPEVLGALNASASHGTLLYILRQTNQSDTIQASAQELLDALFMFLSALLQTLQGGQMLMSAGIIQTLLHIVENAQSVQLKNTTKVVGLLDTILNNVATSFSAFCNYNGVDILLTRIKNEVEFSLKNAETSPSTEVWGPLAPYDRVSLVKAMLKFLIHMLESSGTTDGLRNLVESSAPSSLKMIIENPKVFGNSVFASATNVVTTFIHNEPTSLAILQEQGLPQSFLRTIIYYQNPNGEVLMSALHAFGAICLNANGLDMFNATKPLSHFFELMTAPDFLRSTTELDGATALGSTMDELTRHHPSLKPDVFKCIKEMIVKSLAIGAQDIGKPSDNSHLLQLRSADDEEPDLSSKPDDWKSECLTSSCIDFVSRFLEGFLQSQSNIREFVKEECPDLLLDYYTLPMLPTGFAGSMASDSLMYLFRTISGVSFLPTVVAVAEKVKRSIRFIASGDLPTPRGIVQEFIDVKENESDKIERGNRLLQQLKEMFGYLNLLSKLCSSTEFSHGKTGVSLLNELTSDNEDNVITLLGQVDRIMVWEDIILQESVPKSWLASKQSKSNTDGNPSENALGISSNADSSKQDSMSTETKEEEKVPDPKDPRMINLKHFKAFLSGSHSVILPILQSLTKLSVSRRMMDSSQRELAFKLGQLTTGVLKESLSWVDVTSDLNRCKYDYLSSAFSMVSSLLLDDRSHRALMTPLAVMFHRQGGTALLVNLLDNIWTATERTEEESGQDPDKEQSEYLAKIYRCLELLFAVLLNLVSPNLLSDSPYTSVIVSKDDPDSPLYFEPAEYMVSVQLKVLAIRKYLKSPLLNKIPKFVVRTFLKCITQILSSEDEVNVRQEPHASFILPVVTPISRATVTPDPNGVQSLIEMGFDRSRAERAMVRCNNQISRAVDYLFSHPADPIDPTPDASSQNATAGLTSNNASEQASGEDQDPSSASVPEQQEPGDVAMNESDGAAGEGSDNGESNDDYDHTFTDSFLFGSNSIGESSGRRSSAKSGDRHKTPEEANKLRDERSLLRQEIPELMLTLIEKREDLVFDAHDLLVVLLKDDSKAERARHIASLLVERIQAIPQSTTESTKLCTLLRLLALMLKEKAMQPVISDCVTRMPFLFDMLFNAKEILSQESSPLPNWLAAVLLILEIFIAHADEPQSVKLDTPHTNENQHESEDKMAIDSQSEEPSNERFVTANQRTQMLECGVLLLKRADLSKDDAFATLRIIVLLTKQHGAALQFVHLGGLGLLFARPRRALDGLQGQKSFIILILRHIVEDAQVLEDIMRDIITTWGTVSRPRNMEIDTFLRDNAAIALRHPDIFVKVATSVCALSRYTEYDFNQQIKILKETNETDKPSEPSSAKSDMSFDKMDSSSGSTTVIHHLLNELMTTCSQDKDDHSPSEEETLIKFAYKGFLLQCLVELVSSYSSCKYDIYAYSRRRGSKESSRGRHSILNLLINELLPYNAIDPSDDESRKQQGLSMWTAATLVAMCYDVGTKETENEANKNELLAVRKYVLEGVIRSFKDTIASTDAVSVKYNKYLALSDLCHRILNASPNTSVLSSFKSKENTPAELAKIMLDKSFVPVLTSAISDVDVNYPQAKNILNQMLRPLEQLTKASIQIEPLSVDDEKEAEEEEEVHDIMTTGDTDEEEEATPDLYRHSSLGMLEGSAMDEDDLEELGTSEEEGASMEEEDDFGDETGSDLSDVMDGEDDEDDIDEEMEVVMHRHPYDSEEDEEGDEEEMDFDDEDDDQHDDDDDDSLSDDSIDSEVSDEDDDEADEITWHLEDIDGGDGPVLHVHTEIEIDTEEDEEEERRRVQRHTSSRFEEGQDEDLDTLDQSDFEDEGSGSYDEDGAEGELNDGILMDDDEIHDPLLGDLHEEDALFDESIDRPRMRGNLYRVERPFGGRLVHRGNGQFDLVASSGVSRERTSQDDSISHPLLTEGGPSEADHSTSTHISRLLASHSRPTRIYGLGNPRLIEDIIPRTAIQMLEGILSSSLSYRDGRGSGMGGVMDFRSMPSQSTDSRHGQAAASQRQAEGGKNREVISLLHDFQPLSTSERWRQEGRMMYDNTMADKAKLLANAILNVLIPIAVEEKKKRDENLRKQAEEARQKAEERRKAAEKKKEEEEQRRREEEEKRAAAEAAEAAAAMQSTQEEPSVADTTAQGGAPSASQPERTMITINGEEVDISGTGIDIEFLEALPDDLREEVVSQHLRERRASTQMTEDSASGISPEFLDVLPPDIREEVMQQEASERNRRERQRVTDERIERLREPMNVVSRMRSLFSGELDEEAEESPQNTAAVGTSLRDTRKSGAHDTIQLVDRSQLAMLARLLFIPQQISRGTLNRVLLNLCENSKSRGDLLSLLICILQDGSVDLAAVDRSFTQLSLHAKGQKSPKRRPSLPLSSMGDNVPNLITQRCLEVLVDVVTSNDQSLSYFLTENECFAGLKRSSSKKGKAKEKPTVAKKYPLLVLMGLLDRPIFMENTNLMEQLTRLLAVMCRPFPLLVKKYEEKIEARRQLEQEKTRRAAQNTGAAAAQDTKVIETRDDKPDDTRGETRPSDLADEQITKELEKPVPKPTTIPDHYLKMVVHILTSGECSGKTFQHTLSVLSYLSSMEGAMQMITNELMTASRHATSRICHDLEELLHVIEHAMIGTDIPSAALSQFSAASSHQAKLLRVLKTIDYLYSRKPGSKDEEEAKEAVIKNEQHVLQIYEELDFLPLWKSLGHCLTVVHEKEELMNVATVLLPLIESFMVVNKHIASRQMQRPASYVPMSPGTEQSAQTDTSASDAFFAFTEDHKKILNVMVRNNPSLMSGSFALLVRNPKMLEFDNKHNYFIQQLHKRNEPREHFPPLQLNVRRQYVFEDSYHQLQGRTGDEIKYGKLLVKFCNEEGVDAGGVSREWFSVLARSMFDPNYALFITSAADKLTYQPNRASGVSPDHLSLFKFVGRVIGKAVYDGRLLDAYFTRSFYKHILGRTVDYRDVEAVDPEYYKSLVWMLDNDITDVIDLTFSIDTDDFGATKTIDLKPGGRDIPVTQENKHEYVQLVAAHKLTNAIKDQINAFVQGFHDIIPPSLIQIFNEQELELLISGLPDIDIDDWKNNTVYETYTPSSPQIQWFWRAVRSFDQEERAKLLQFATGTSKVPLEGFAHLQGSGGVQKFQIHKDFGGENRLPSAHTCFNQVDLPEYNSYESLRNNLFKAINECSTGFSFV